MEVRTMLNEGVKDVTDRLGFARRAKAIAMFPWFGANACAFVPQDCNMGAGSRARFAGGTRANSHPKRDSSSPTKRCAFQTEQALGADWVQIPQTSRRPDHRLCPA